MTSPASETPSITELPDDALHLLAREWRSRALQGDKPAMGTAHELEVEMRRRQRMRGTGQEALAELPPLQTLAELPSKWFSWSGVMGSRGG